MTDDHLKNISIRGVNADIYEAFSNKIKDLDLNIGEALSKIMEEVVADFDETFPEISSASLKAIAGLTKGSIQHHRNLTITKHDLVSADMRVYFQHIDVLEFAPDVDLETFEKYVGSIQHIRTLRVPTILPKLKLLAMVQHVKEVEIYDGDE